jgi:hypothetical protein
MTDSLSVARRVADPDSGRRSLFVVVDTEEEFDWDAPYSRENVGVTAMRYIDRVQRIFDRFGLKPTYVIDYPVASTPDGYLPLVDIWRDRRCTVGAHVHPWVNPPHDEALGPRNSFLMNLPERLQEAKLRALVDAIGSRFDAPRVFKAGRYGLSAATVPLLEGAGFEVDTSVCPRHDFSAQHGPSFDSFDSEPFFLTPALLEVPCTADYTGWAGPLRQGLHRMASAPAMAPLRAVGVLSRMRASNRIMLSPEGNTFEEMQRLARALVRRGLRAFTLSFHSPSVVPGHTPYVRTERDLSVFLASIERFCDFFFGELDGVPDSHLEYRARLLSTADVSV